MLTIAHSGHPGRAMTFMKVKNKPRDMKALGIVAVNLESITCWDKAGKELFSNMPITGFAYGLNRSSGI